MGLALRREARQRQHRHAEVLAGAMGASGAPMTKVLAVMAEQYDTTTPPTARTAAPDRNLRT